MWHLHCTICIHRRSPFKDCIQFQLAELIRASLYVKWIFCILWREFRMARMTVQKYVEWHRPIDGESCAPHIIIIINQNIIHTGNAFAIALATTCANKVNWALFTSSNANIIWWLVEYIRKRNHFRRLQTNRNEKRTWMNAYHSLVSQDVLFGKMNICVWNGGENILKILFYLSDGTFSMYNCTYSYHMLIRGIRIKFVADKFPWPVQSNNRTK